ncbi:predicted protein [Histoplasma mississippiense (nom. inval.)]|uniref:predicted protein n=1 Tax=Ajellomyces capsulatus (strain NAm1 / WU24) TaxID=2059318 RepID=UPI000157CBD3|nr:predicted protein [Histoplasma mississippiense (nom. inval.)]EDN10504.1 predicted protein [Histoplasma mississippiense (nom. inval.)]
MVVTPVFMGWRMQGLVEGWSLMDSVCTSTPGTSVREFRGPAGCRPILRVGRRSRIRGRELDSFPVSAAML